MSNIDDLLSQIPIGQLAGQLGLSEPDTEQAVRQALPALVEGMKANASDPAGAASLEKALGQHDGSLLEGGIDLAQVDTTDGEKIVRNIFGDNEEAVVNQLGAVGGGSGTIGKLLPMVAPLLMSFLGKSFGGGSDATSAAATSGGGGGLDDLLGGLLGGGDDGGGGLGGLGDLLGGLLGGGKR